MAKNCPWCGHALTTDVTVCAKCKWTREKPNMRPAFLAFGFFILLSVVLAFAAIKWVSSQTGDLRPPMNMRFLPEMRLDLAE